MARIGGFSGRTIKQLAEAADHCCARCYQKTSYFDSKLNKRIGYGRGAHAVAASSGGPRADPLYTVEQLKAADNGVHLCANCADLIDKDPNSYSIDYLQNLQRVAEERVRTSVLQPGSSGALLTADQSQRLSLFINQASECIAQLYLFKGHRGWEGSWNWREAEKATDFVRNCAWINQLHHALCAGTRVAIDMQCQVVEAIRTLRSQVKEHPWFYENDWGRYKLSTEFMHGSNLAEANAAGEKHCQYQRDIYRLIDSLRGLLSGGSGVKKHIF